MIKKDNIISVKLYNWSNGITNLQITTPHGVSGVPIDPTNIDYQEYLKWVAEGNTPEPADQPE